MLAQSSFCCVLVLIVLLSIFRKPSSIFSLNENPKDLNVWPYPRLFRNNENGTSIEIQSIEWKLFDEKTQTYINIKDDIFIHDLVGRYEKFIFNEVSKDKKERKGVTIPLTISVKDITSRKLVLETSEAYTLDVSVSEVKISCDTIFGALRGVETFTQLAHSLDKLPIHVEDSPRYPWRGLLVDVSRHYLKIETLEKVVNGMSYNKLNVLHLHLTDAQSWPLVIEKFPLLSEKGAYDNKKAIYTKQQMKDFVKFAYQRGVRVVPELDICGHARVIGLGYPETTAKCPKYEHNMNNIPLNPIEPLTKKLIQGVIDEFAEIFDDQYIHLGGDELVYGCWDDDKNISEYMKKHKYSGPDLQSEFMKDIFDHTDRTSISWAERALEEAKYKMPNDAIVQAWKGADDMKKVLEKGPWKILNSGGWYIDRMIPVPPLIHYLMLDVWLDMYSIEIDDYVEEKYRDRVLGGEGCMWAEQVNDDVIIQRIFPKACAFSERLWSPKSVNFVKDYQKRKEEWNLNCALNMKVNEDIETVQNRLISHICHNLLQRGIGSSPLRPDYCPT